MKRTQAGEIRPGKERERIIRFLSAGEAAPRSAARAGAVLLDGGERGTISVAARMLAALAREGVLSRHGSLLVLTAEGLALARRSATENDPFRAQHMELGVRMLKTGDGQRVVTTNLAESPLGQLARRRSKNGDPFLEESEFRAGERLRIDYTRGQIMPRIGANWSEAVASGRRGGSENGAAELTDIALAARQRVDDALAAVGPELAGVLVDVCCFLKGLEQVEAERGWPVRSAKVVLKTGLAALSRHYEPNTRPRRRAILHWGASDYRPRPGR